MPPVLKVLIGILIAEDTLFMGSMRYAIGKTEKCQQGTSSVSVVIPFMPFMIQR